MYSLSPLLFAALFFPHPNWAFLGGCHVVATTISTFDFTIAAVVIVICSSTPDTDHRAATGIAAMFVFLAFVAA